LFQIIINRTITGVTESGVRSQESPSHRVTESGVRSQESGVQKFRSMANATLRYQEFRSMANATLRYQEFRNEE